MKQMLLLMQTKGTEMLFPESASGGFLLCTPSPGGVDRAPDDAGPGRYRARTIEKAMKTNSVSSFSTWKLQKQMVFQHFEPTRFKNHKFCSMFFGLDRDQAVNGPGP